jgi:hypothetical protein
MTARNLAARFVFMAVVCAGLVFSAGETQRVEAQCTVKFGAACQAACPHGWSVADDNCWNRFSSLYVSTISCDSCNFPGYIQGFCDDFSHWEFNCF